jgi:hypothetical protein
VGHVQSGGEIAGPEDPLAPEAVWPLWRGLVREFRFHRLLWRLVRSPSGLGYYGVDVISTLRTMPSAKRALARLEGAPDLQLERLARIADLNARRNEAHWRLAALFYITVPGSLFLAGLQGAPEYTRSMIADMGPWATGVILAVMLQMLYYFATQWRARQVEAIIELVRIDRLSPPSAPVNTPVKGKRRPAR